MPSDRPNTAIDEPSFQKLLWAAFTIQEYNNRNPEGILTRPSEEPAEPIDLPSNFLQEIVERAHHVTGASSAAIALQQQGGLICRATAGDSASDIDAMINTGAGFTGLCASSGTLQLCSNTALKAPVDVEAYRKLGIRALIVVPIFHQDQSLGLIAVFSGQPYAFGVRDVQALQDLVEKFIANMELKAESAKSATDHQPPETLNLAV